MHKINDFESFENIYIHMVIITVDKINNNIYIFYKYHIDS